MNITGISLGDISTETVHILIVEDEYILALNLQESLESLGYTVVAIVDSGEAAISTAIDLRPTLILMDIRLRGEMDGIMAAERIWAQLQIPIIYVTGHSDKTTVERATFTFPFAYILKPIRERELYAAIQTALNRFEREQFLSNVLQSIGDGVLVTDRQLRVKYLNPTAETLTGWPTTEARGQPVSTVLQLIDEATQTAAENPLVTALQQEKTVYLDRPTLLTARDGRSIPVADSATPIRDRVGSVTGGVLVFRDDTQRRLAEERNLAIERARQLESQMAEMQRLNQLKEDFLATTSHELRTPLSNIKLAICLLETVLRQHPLLLSSESAIAANVARYLAVLHEQCDQELRLISDLLDLRSLDANAYPLDPISIQLQEWLPHLAESFQLRLQSQQQTLTVTVPQTLPRLMSDLPTLTRIMTELLNNACKYTPSGETITLTAQLLDPTPPDDANTTRDRVLARESLAFIQLIVSNSGIEIPPTELVRVFEPFYRIPDNDPYGHGGSGLGLALVKKLVEYLRGTIAVTSAQGWTTFVVQLPLA